MGRFVSDVFGALTGRNSQKAAERGAELQSEAAVQAAEIEADAAREALDRLTELNAPFVALGEQAIPGLTGFIEDPTGASFLEGNPLFQAAVDDAAERTLNLRSAQGRASAGGTTDELFQNFLSIGDRFVNSAFNRLLAPTTLGQNAAAFQGTTGANLLNRAAGAEAGGITGGANAIAAGQIGGQNAFNQGINNLLGAGLTAAAIFSDERLKENVIRVGEKDGLPVYEFNYTGDETRYIGHMAQDVAEYDPDSVTVDENGWMRVSAEYAPEVAWQ